MYDKLGNKIVVDDWVVFTPSKRGIVLGQIIGYTSEQVEVEYNNTWDYAAPGKKHRELMYHSAVVKVVLDD